MKYVLVLNQFAIPRSQGGGTRHVELFSRVNGWEPTIVASSRKHDSRTIFRTDDKRFKLAWVPGYSGAGLSRMTGWAIFAVQAVVIGLTRRRVDVVYASSPQLLVPVAGALVSTLRRVPLIVEVRDLWPESIVAAGLLRPGSRVHKLLVGLERWIYKRADEIVVVTPGWEEHFAELGVNQEKVHVVPNGAEPSDFQVSQTRTALRLGHGVSGFTAVFAGSHGPKDGIDLVLDAAAKLPEINFLLIGAGSSKTEAEQRAQKEKLANVEFRSAIPKSELGGLLRACDVGIHAVSPMTVFEKGMSPNKLFDYLASELPVVSNAENALRAIIVDGECGYLGGPHSLSDNLRRVYEASPEQRRAWGETGCKVIVSRYSRSVSARRLEDILETVGPK
ncbi:MAG: hypothetical protein QOE58_1267 [Actinomycetota bacterium]|nr:hypothetical protein [Actinomycetota bacterium]